MLGRGNQRLLVRAGRDRSVCDRTGPQRTVEFAVPEAAHEWAEEIVRLSQDYSSYGADFKSVGDVLAPALLYGLRHMHRRYTMALMLEAVEED